MRSQPKTTDERLSTWGRKTIFRCGRRTKAWLLSLCFLSTVALTPVSRAQDYTESFDGKALERVVVQGDVSYDSGKNASGAGGGSMKVAPGGRASVHIQDTDGAGKVTFWIYDDGHVEAKPKARHIGPHWGVLGSDGHLLAAGVIYAPYLSGDKSHAMVEYDPAKKQTPLHGVRYLGLPRKTGWRKWEFSFDPDKGLDVLCDGKSVNAKRKRFDWNKSRTPGFAGVVIVGDSGKADGQSVWVDDISVTDLGKMNVKPTPPPPPPPVTPDKDPIPEQKVLLKKELRNVHPRLIFGAEDIAAMKVFGQTEDGQRSMKKLADYVDASTPPKREAVKFLKDSEDAMRHGLWRAPTVGLHYLLTGDEVSKEKAIGYLKLFLELEHWELGQEQDLGMGSSNIAIGAALLYDWLYNDLDPAFRAQLRDKLLLMARRQYHRGHLKKAKSVAYWQGDPQNNHRWHRDGGLALCVLAAAEDDKDDDEWILVKLKEELDFVHKWLPKDGTSHEGPTYMTFGIAQLVLASQAADRCLETHYLDNEFYKNVPRYVLSSLTPGFRSYLIYGDGGGANSADKAIGLPFCGNAYFAGSTRHQDKDVIAALWHLDSANPDTSWLGWMQMVWRTPTQKLRGGDWRAMPKNAFWPDVGVLDLRDSWDAGGVSAMFKCGPLGGYTMNRFRNENNFQYINVAHDDPDANTFIIFNDGQFTVTPDGYSFAKNSRNHNTILVNGCGQMTSRLVENQHWNQPGSGDMTKMAVVTTFKEDGDVVVIEGEASGSYPAISKPKKGQTARPALSQFRRTFIWVKGKYVLVLDAVEAPSPVDITWLLQGLTLTEKDKTQGVYSVANKEASCDFQVVADTTASAEIADIKLHQRWHDNDPRQQLQLTANGAKMRFASVYNPWQQKSLKLTLVTENENQATVVVAGPGFKDEWKWERPAGLFTPSRISGAAGEKAIRITDADTAPVE